MIDDLFEKKLTEKASHIVRLVQGNQALEGAALDSAGCDKLLQYVKQLLRDGPREKVMCDLNIIDNPSM